VSGPERQASLFERGELVEADAAAPVHGVVERVTFHNPENGYCVLRVKPDGRTDTVTVVGRVARVNAGERVRAEGAWTNDPKFGRQYRAEKLHAAPPNTREGIRRYLASGSVAGIGPGLAERLVEAFGEDVFDVIDRQPQRLEDVPGVGRKRAAQLVGAWTEDRRTREIMVFLHGHGVGTSHAVRIYRTYGDAAVERIRADPYRLAQDIRGIGFARSDALAKRLGTDPESRSRARAGLRHVLNEARGVGHCGLPVDELVARAVGLLEVDAAIVRRALDSQIESGEWVAGSVSGRACAFDSELFRMEQQAASVLARLATGEPPWTRMRPDGALRAVEKQLGIRFASGQRDAIGCVLASKASIITGGPGVGKTTLVRALLAMLTGFGVRVLLAAPTGRAARRLSDATGLEARTLHRLLEADPRRGGFKRGPRRPLDCDLLVVDEASMIDVPLLHALVQAIPARAALVMIGDVDQLPSVGPGQVLADAIASGVLRVVRLDEVFRQQAGSQIVHAAHRIQRGEMPAFAASPDADCHFVEADDPDTAAERIVTIVRERIPARFGFDPIRDIQVLCPMHRGRTGARSLNLELQQAIHPTRSGEPSVERFGWRFSRGDKVMQTDNDYEREVFNGDLGFVCDIDADAAELGVEFDGRRVAYPFEELDRLVLAYATTIHKSQGSEYPAVVIPLSTAHYPMLKRNLVYTGVTRARRLVVLVGQRRALGLALRDAESDRRWSMFGHWLRAGRDPAPLPGA
jgi:exodeoxyribonuclease V alpha subunit